MTAWLAQVPIDDDKNLKREFGTKTLLLVPENHIAGAFRMMKGGDEGEKTKKASKTQDGESSQPPRRMPISLRKSDSKACNFAHF